MTQLDMNRTTEWIHPSSVFIHEKITLPGRPFVQVLYYHFKCCITLHFIQLQEPSLPSSNLYARQKVNPHMYYGPGALMHHYLLYI